MGDSRIEHTIYAEGITAGDAQDSCDICHSNKDVAQCIGIIGVTGDMPDGVASVFFICSRCAALAIQVTTGFRAVNTLNSWYRVRAVHAAYKGDRTLVDPDKGEPVG